MIITNKYEIIFRNDEEIFKKLIRLVFKKGIKSLYYSSPFIVEDLLTLTERN